MTIDGKRYWYRQLALLQDDFSTSYLRFCRLIEYAPLTPLDRRLRNSSRTSTPLEPNTTLSTCPATHHIPPDHLQPCPIPNSPSCPPKRIPASVPPPSPRTRQPHPHIRRVSSYSDDCARNDHYPDHSSPASCCECIARKPPDQVLMGLQSRTVHGHGAGWVERCESRTVIAFAPELLSCASL